MRRMSAKAIVGSGMVLEFSTWFELHARNGEFCCSQHYDFLRRNSTYVSLAAFYILFILR
jgi:hypothetical protein